MKEDNENVEVSGMSKFNKILLTIVAALLIFVGPTYIPYVLANLLKLDYVASILVGAALFIAGLIMLIYLIRKKIVA